MEIITIGRSKQCDIRFEDPYVSSIHMQIVKHSENKYTIIDQNSRNGTYVNGQKAVAEEEQEIVKTDILKIGNTLLKWNEFFEKEKIIQKQDSNATIPSENEKEAFIGNENPTFEDGLPEELFIKIEAYATDGVYSPKEEKELKLYCTQNDIDYDNAALPLLINELDRVKKDINEEKDENKSYPQNLIYASFGQRLGAYILDTILISIFAGVLVFTVLYIAIEGMNMSQNDAIVLAYITAFVTPWLYYAGSESSKQQATFGKQAIRIKVVNRYGEKIGFLKATGRHLGKLISTFILLIGYLMPLWTEKKQALHDIMADCYIVESKK